ncbi:MAG TPA: hypothetical protein VNV66_22135 [Pilimelia sp.]|nr:hypothetical protein [Pilimelia sp.]
MSRPVSPAAAGDAAPGRGPRRQPTGPERRALRGIVAELGACSGHAPLTIVFTAGRRTEAAWLCAQARSAGLPVRLVPASAPDAGGGLPEPPGPASGGPVVALVDHDADLPPGVTVLPGTPAASPLALWRPAAEVDAAVAALLARLDRRLLLRTGGAALRVRTGPAAPARPVGAVRADVTDAAGTFVADGAIAVNRRTGWDARLAGRAVRLTVADGRVVAVDCPDAQLRGFLRRAVGTHRVDVVRAVRFGVHPAQCAFSAVQGPVNARRPGVTLCLGVEPGRAYSTASADLRVALTAATTRLEPDPGGPAGAAAIEEVP